MRHVNDAYDLMKALLELSNVISAQYPGVEKERERLLSIMRWKIPELLEAVEQDFYENHQFKEAAKSKLTELSARIRDEHKLHDSSVRIQVWQMTEGKCAYCGTSLASPDLESDDETMFVEHVVPRSKGGPDNLANYVPSCRSCNNLKGDRHVIDVIRKLQLRGCTNVVEIKKVVEAAE